MEKVFKKILQLLSYILICAIVALAFAIPVHKQSDRKIDFYDSLELVDRIKAKDMDMTTVIYAKNSKGKWVEYRRIHGEENRLWIPLKDIPKNLRNAFIAIEDMTFYEHSGINWKRTVGALGNYIFEYDDTEYGGSTITQQLIKNMTLDKDKSAERKAREIVRSAIVETELSKDEILEAYLNTIALGNGYCGVRIAANYYYNKEPKDLTLAECASIAAITQNPSKYNPITKMDANEERRNVVLKEMLDAGFIKEKEYKKAVSTKLKINQKMKKKYEPAINDYFLDTVIDQAVIDFSKKYSCSEDEASKMLYSGGYKIYSTVNTKVQNIMEDTYSNVKKYFSQKARDDEGNNVHVQSAMTIMDYEGHIVGIVGGAGKKTVNRGLNRATDSPRHPGSTMKPIGVYTLAVEKDIVHYTSIVEDEPLPDYFGRNKPGPHEWYGFYKGKMTVDYAIRTSANTIPVWLLQDVGLDASYKFLTKDLGMKHLVKKDKNPSSLALGGCMYGITTTESAAAYAIYGNGGVYHKPTAYSEILDTNNKPIIKYDTKGKQVISEETATIMNYLLQGVVRGSGGTGGGIRRYSSMKVYAKTGTSSESKDLWMVAGTPYYVGSVWYGFDTQRVVYNPSAAANVWRDVMREIHEDLEEIDFEYSDKVYRRGSGYYKEGTHPDNTRTISGTKTKDDAEKDKDKKPEGGTTPEQTPTTPPSEGGNETPTPKPEDATPINEDS